jgi:serine/threonine protein kinase
MHAGLVVSGRFEVVRKLGQGGMGEVWEGLDQLLGRRVAIKTLAVNPGADAVRRFQAEARIGASLSHPGITVVYDIGQYESALYLVMEYLEGGDLKELLDQGRLSVDRVLEISVDLLKALQAAHAQGVVHRDIKPGNVMILSNGQLKICDFGIARFTDATMTGSVIGTPGYMAPEQFTGQEIDGRCDLYSFGIVLYELLTGQLPFRCHTLPEFVYAHLQKIPDPPRLVRPDIPDPLNRLILDLMAKDREDRPADAAAVLARIEALRGNPASGGRSSFPSALRQEPARQEPARQEPARQEPVRQEPGQREYGRQEPVQRDYRRQEPVQPQTPAPFVAPQAQPPFTPQGYGAAPQTPPPFAPEPYGASTYPPQQPVPTYQQPYGYVPQPQFQAPPHYRQGQPSQATGPVPASWLRRAAAYFFDWWLGFWFGFFVYLPTTIGEPEEAEMSNAQAALFMLAWAVAYVVMGLMEGVLGWSPGKRIAGLRVVHADTGQYLGPFRGVVRIFAQIVDWWSFCLGFLWPLWDRNKQTFSDKLCNTRVIKVRY